MQIDRHLESADFPALARIIGAVLELWPEHERFLTRSFGDRDGDVAECSERVGAMILALEGEDLRGACEDYRWTCAKLQEEEIEFRRSLRYRHTSFSEVERAVYSNSDFMKRYLRGLLLSQVLWANHAAVVSFYVNRFLATTLPGGDFLEVGPGHGILLGLAAMGGRQASVSGWDISPTAIQLTQRALEKLGVTQPIQLATGDVLARSESGSHFTAIIASELLEHLEEPEAALIGFRRLLVPGGRLFISVPLNSPAPDHIYLLRSPDEAVSLVERSGFRVVEARHFPMGGYTLDRAQRLGLTISSALIAEPAGSEA
jgi:2-polyprenyl-3-methyl-5-hydroxy-6-metoxy-1,4-benzoquinol methylase